MEPVRSVTCKASEFCVGRADGTIEFFVFDNYIHSEDGNEIVNLEQRPKLTYEYNCGERLTSIAICKNGQLIICSTFTGCIFAFLRDSNQFTRTDLPVSREDSFDESIEKDSAMRIEELEMECELLEERLNKERDHYQKLTSSVDTSSNSKVNNFIKDNQHIPVSALPYFSINDSFVLQDNAFYLLTIECEAPIDCILFQSETRFDLIDCERNSAVISLSENKHSSFYNSIIPNGPLNSNQILTSFRCQANTTRLEIKISSIEGQFGQFKAYILTKVTPKSCQVRNYTIKALSMHRRKYFDIDKNNHLDDVRNVENRNTLIITGNFSLNEAYSWLYYTLPEIPDKLSNLIESRVEFQYTSTLVGTDLRIELIKNRIYFESDNVSTISILKDFITREATRRSIPVELKLDLNKLTINTVLTAIYAKLCILIKHRNNTKLREAIKEIETIDSAIANQMLNQLDTHENHLIELGLRGDQNELDRLYGLITDLFIDYEKLNGNNTENMMNIFKAKLQEMITLIETYVGDEYNVDIFIQKIIQFWQF